MSPGERFTASTPDGQQVEVEVPRSAAPALNVTFYYTPLESLGKPVSRVVGQTVMGEPVSGGGGGAPMDASRGDREASMMGWMLHATGWFMCCWCGPVGLIFWSAALCIFFTKSKDVQRSHPQERTVAMINGVTCGVCACPSIIFMIFIIILVATGSSEDDSSGSVCDYAYQVHNSWYDCTVGREEEVEQEEEGFTVRTETGEGGNICS